MANAPDETQEYTPRTATFIEEREYTIPLPDTRNLVTEDDTPVDNLYSAKASLCTQVLEAALILVLWLPQM
jgi:hypothetical protein